MLEPHYVKGGLSVPAPELYTCALSLFQRLFRPIKAKFDVKLVWEGGN